MALSYSSHKDFGIIGVSAIYGRPLMGICTEPGCTRKARGRGLCGMHYQCRWKNGTLWDIKEWTREGNGLKRDFETRWKEDVDKNGPNGCWIWKPTKGVKGSYGKIPVWNGCRPTELTAHRVAYEKFVGPIPEGMLVLHKCNNANCVNPDHLYTGTHKDNMRDLAESGNRKGVCCGSKNGRAKLNFEIAEKIRSLYLNGRATQNELARQYNVSQFAISQIVRGKRYKEPNV